MRLTRWADKALILGAAVVVWELVARMIGSAFLPGPIVVVETFVRVARTGDATGLSLTRHTVASLQRVLLGFAIAALAAVPLGLLLGLSARLYAATSVLVDTIRFIPPLAWVPIAIMLMRGPQRYLFIIVLGAFFPILLATMGGVARVNPIHLDVFKVFGFGRWDRVRKVVLPSALPEIVSGLRISLGISWGILVAAELVGAGVDGLGRMMLTHAELLQTDIVVVGMVVIGVLGYVMNAVVLRFEARLFRWRQKVEL
jgi:sulfonate transport system permease protein